MTITLVATGIGTRPQQGLLLFLAEVTIQKERFPALATAHRLTDRLMLNTIFYLQLSTSHRPILRQDSVFQIVSVTLLSLRQEKS